MSLLSKRYILLSNLTYDNRQGKMLLSGQW